MSKKRSVEETKAYQQIVESEPYCQLCGSTYYLQIHHIFYRSELGLTTPKNLIRLCARCHRLVHSNKAYWQPLLLEKQYKKYGKFEDIEICKRFEFYKEVNL